LLIDGRTGELTPLNRVDIGPGSPAQIAIAPEGGHAIVANYGSGEYLVVRIESDGSLGPVVDVVRNTGSGPHPRQDAAHPHAVAFDPAGRYLGAADLGTDTVQTFRLCDERLQQVSGVAMPPGTGPRHIAYSADAMTVCVIGELDGNITAIAYDPATGALGDPRQTMKATWRAVRGACPVRR
jgi:6-phosphogluconolactonase